MTNRHQTIVQKILRDWIVESKILSAITYRLRHEEGQYTLTIYTDHPGWMIGVAGTLGNKYRDILCKELNVKKVNFVEVDGVAYPLR